MSLTFLLACNKSERLSSDSANIDTLLVKARDEKDARLKLRKADIIFAKIGDSRIDSIAKSRYIRLAAVYQSLEMEEKCAVIYEAVLSNPSLPVNHSETAFANLFLGNYHYNKSEYLMAFENFSKAEKSFGILNNFEYQGYAINLKANILNLKKDYIGAEVLAVKALKIAKDEQNHDLAYNAYLTLGNSSNGLNDFQKAIEYYQKAIQATEHLRANPNYLAFNTQPLNYLSKVYQKKGNFKKSISFAEKGLRFKEIRSEEPSIYCYLTNNLAYSQFLLGQNASPHQFLETLKIGDSIQNIPIQITSKTYLGELYLARNNRTKAIYYLRDAQRQAHRNSIFDDELHILQLLATADPGSRSYYAERYISLSDSLHNVERATRNKFARIEFETDEITDERDSLSVEREALSMQRWLIAGVSVFSLLSVFLWFKNKSQKAKTRELLLKQEQQKADEEIYQLMLTQQQKLEEGKNLEKKRISLELHDGVMGKLSAVRLNLYASLYKAELLEDRSVLTQIDEIQAVEKEIRSIAHDLSVNLFSDNSTFIEMVRVLFARIENHSEIQFELHVSEAVNLDAISTSAKINLYRILQEALQNIEKYAHATRVSVTMRLSDLNEISVVISDNGKGFDTAQKISGIGLSNMETRMAEVGGKISIHSQISNGTEINLTIPI